MFTLRNTLARLVALVLIVLIYQISFGGDHFELLEGFRAANISESVTSFMHTIEITVDSKGHRSR